jgi:hypothetical protein
MIRAGGHWQSGPGRRTAWKARVRILYQPRIVTLPLPPPPVRFPGTTPTRLHHGPLWFGPRRCPVRYQYDLKYY